MPRGNPDNLRAAAQRKRQAATQRAEAGLQTLIADGEPITFRGLAKAAGVSIDFLYRSPLRARVEELRAERQSTPPGHVGSAREIEPPASQSNVVRALTMQISELKQRHRTEIEHLKAALAAAQGENLEVRRRLGRDASAPPPAALPERNVEVDPSIDAPPGRAAAGR